MRRVGGFALISALFVIVILSAAVVFMLQVGTVQTATATLGQSGTQAYYAARGGVEWGVYQVVNGGAVPTPACNDVMNLDGYTVTVSCTTTGHSDPSPRYVTVVSSVAVRGTPGSPEYVSRRVDATVAVPAP